jgi:hypothetical protein
MNSYITLKEFYQLIFIWNAKCDGWKVKKIDDNMYEFKKHLKNLSIEELNSVNTDDYIHEFIKKNSNGSKLTPKIKNYNTIQI